MKKVLLMIIMVVGVLVNSSPGEAVAKADDTDFYNDDIAYHSPATNKPTASGSSRSEQSARSTTKTVVKPEPAYTHTETTADPIHRIQRISLRKQEAGHRHI